MECLKYGRLIGAGVADERDAVAKDGAASEFIRRDLGALLESDHPESFGLDSCSDELQSVVTLADELGLRLELSASVAKAYARALERYGPVDGELLAVALLEERAVVY